MAPPTIKHFPLLTDDAVYHSALDYAEVVSMDVSQAELLYIVWRTRAVKSYICHNDQSDS